MIVLKILGYVVFLVAQLTGVLLAALTLPGSLLVLVSAIVCSAATGWHRPSWGVLVLLAALALVTELVDNIMAMLGVQRFGGSRWTSVAAGVGALAGGILAGVLAPAIGIGALIGGPLGWILTVAVLPLIGAFAGGFLVAYALELSRGANKTDATRAGVGAVLGRVLGAIVKVTLTTVMAIIATAAAFWPSPG